MVPKYGTGGYNIIYELGRRDDSTYKNREEIELYPTLWNEYDRLENNPRGHNHEWPSIDLTKFANPTQLYKQYKISHLVLSNLQILSCSHFTQHERSVYENYLGKHLSKFIKV